MRKLISILVAVGADRTVSHLGGDGVKKVDEYTCI